MQYDWGSERHERMGRPCDTAYTRGDKTMSFGQIDEGSSANRQLCSFLPPYRLSFAYCSMCFRAAKDVCTPVLRMISALGKEQMRPSLFRTDSFYLSSVDIQSSFNRVL